MFINLIDKAAVKLSEQNRYTCTQNLFDKRLHSPLPYHSYDSSFLAYIVNGYLIETLDGLDIFYERKNFRLGVNGNSAIGLELL